MPYSCPLSSSVPWISATNQQFADKAEEPSPTKNIYWNELAPPQRNCSQSLLVLSASTIDSILQLLYLDSEFLVEKKGPLNIQLSLFACIIQVSPVHQQTTDGQSILLLPEDGICLSL